MPVRSPPSQSSRAADGGDRTRVRTLSKLVFGNLDRFEVAAAIARSDTGVVDATTLSDELGIVNNRVRAQLVALAEAGFLRAEPEFASRRRSYIRLPSAFWTAITALEEEWDAP